MEEGARAGFGVRVPDNFIGGGLAESKSVMCDNVTLTRTDEELTAGDYTFSEHLLTIKTAGKYTLSGTANSNDFRVKVGDRLVTTLTIDNLTINTYREEDERDPNNVPKGYSPLDFSDAGVTTLTLVGKNQLTARVQNPAVFTPWVKSGNKNENENEKAIPLTIDGDGSLVAKGGWAWPGIGNNGSANILIKSGDITAQGGYAAAGIGGSWGFWFDSIVIKGGRVVATGGAGANNDIGCGDSLSGESDHGSRRGHKISITGGVVVADHIFRENKGGETLTQTGGILVQDGAYTVLGNTTLTTNLTIPEGKTLTVPSGKTITIEANGKLEIEKGATLKIEEGAKLVIKDGATLKIEDGATLVMDGITGYEIKYDLNGGEWADGYKPKDYYLSGTEFELPKEEKLNKQGYKFLGWKDKDTGDSVETIPANAKGTQKVVAQWTANKYKVSFNANGGTVTPAEKTVTYGSTYGELPTLTREGYTFAGWFTEKDVGTQVTAVTTVTTAADHMLYAHWTANTHTVKFDANEGTVTPAEKTVTYGSHYGELPTPTRKGYTFVGWFTNPNGGTQVTKETVVKTVADHTLYAHWTANEYTVTFDANGGTVTPADAEMTVTYGNPYGKLPTPTRKGFTFVGWFTNPNGGTQVKEDAEVTTAANRTLYAHWTQNIHTVTIKDDKDGKVIESQQIPEGGLAKKPAKEPVREGYTFIGWQANGAAWDFDQNVVERDTEIIALWEKVVIAPDVAIEGGTSFIVGRATENAMVTIGHNVPGFGVANLAYVDVDGKKLDEKDYDAKTGSIKLNVHAAYLNTLSVGEHTLTAHLKGDGYDGQKVSAKLTVSPVPDASGLPKTGDASAPMVWCALGLACLAGLAAMKRRK